MFKFLVKILRLGFLDRRKERTSQGENDSVLMIILTGSLNQAAL